MASFRVTAEVDGRPVYDGPATLAMVVNGGSLLGGLFRFGPQVAPYAGVLDVCIYAPRTIRDTLAIVWRLLWRNYRRDPRLHFFRGQEIRLSADPVQLFESDGELVSQSPVHISVVPRAATFLVPAARATSSLPRGATAGESSPARAISASNGAAYDSAVADRSSFVRGGAA